MGQQKTFPVLWPAFLALGAVHLSGMSRGCEQDRCGFARIAPACARNPHQDCSVVQISCEASGSAGDPFLTAENAASFGSGYWPAKEIALTFITPLRAGHFQLIRGLNSLNNSDDVKAASQARHCAHNRGALFAPRHVAHEGTINLYFVKWEAAQIGERRIKRTSTKIAPCSCTALCTSAVLSRLAWLR